MRIKRSLFLKRENWKNESIDLTEALSYPVLLMNPNALRGRRE
jgi:hypothetical protein